MWHVEQWTDTFIAFPRSWLGRPNRIELVSFYIYYISQPDLCVSALDISEWNPELSAHKEPERLKQKADAGRGVIINLVGTNESRSRPLNAHVTHCNVETAKGREHHRNATWAAWSTRKLNWHGCWTSWKQLGNYHIQRKSCPWLPQIITTFLLLKKRARPVKTRILTCFFCFCFPCFCF